MTLDIDQGKYCIIHNEYISPGTGFFLTTVESIGILDLVLELGWRGFATSSFVNFSPKIKNRNKGIIS